MDKQSRAFGLAYSAFVSGKILTIFLIFRYFQNFHFEIQSEREKYEPVKSNGRTKNTVSVNQIEDRKVLVQESEAVVAEKAEVVAVAGAVAEKAGVVVVAGIMSVEGAVTEEADDITEINHRTLIVMFFYIESIFPHFRSFFFFFHRWEPII
jgi:hypothetical protein